MGAVESDSVKSAMKAKDKLHKARERASETRDRTLHGQEQNNAYGKHERVTRQCNSIEVPWQQPQLKTKSFPATGHAWA